MSIASLCKVPAKSPQEKEAVHDAYNPDRESGLGRDNTVWAYSHGLETPHSHMENRMGRPVAFRAALIRW